LKINCILTAITYYLEIVDTVMCIKVSYFLIKWFFAIFRLKTILDIYLYLR